MTEPQLELIQGAIEWVAALTLGFVALGSTLLGHPTGHASFRLNVAPNTAAPGTARRLEFPYLRPVGRRPYAPQLRGRHRDAHRHGRPGRFRRRHIGRA